VFAAFFWISGRLSMVLLGNYMRRFSASIICLLAIFSFVSTASAEYKFSFYEGVLKAKKPKAIKSPRGMKTTCTLSGNLNTAFRVDQVGKGIQVDFGGGLILKGKETKKGITAKGSFAGEKYTLEVKPKGKSKTAATATLTTTYHWYSNVVCLYPYSGNVVRTDFVIPTTDESDEE